jgi:hypothetical protein
MWLIIAEGMKAEVNVSPEDAVETQKIPLYESNQYPPNRPMKGTDLEQDAEKQMEISHDAWKKQRSLRVLNVLELLYVFFKPRPVRL